MSAMTAETRADTQPWWREPTRGQWASFFAAWVGWILDAFDFTIFLLVMPLLAKEFHQSITATSVSLTLTLLVRLLGGVVAGAMADKWGRKLPLMISLLWFSACDGAVAFAPSFMWVLILRTIFGFGMGAEWTAGTALAMENWPARSRGIASGVLQGSWAIGYLLAGVISAWVLPHWGWRGLFLLAAGPALLALPIRFFVPESPAWKEAAAQKAAQPSWKEIFSGQTAFLVTVGAVVGMLGFIFYYGITALYPTLLIKTFGQTPAGVAKLIALFNIGMFGGSICAGWVAGKYSVVAAYVVPCLIGCALLPLYVGVWGGLDALPAGSFLMGVFGGGLVGAAPYFNTMLYPPHIRGRCMGTAYHISAMGAAFVPPVIAALSEHGWTLQWSMMMIVGTSGLLMCTAFGVFYGMIRRIERGAHAEQRVAGPLVDVVGAQVFEPDGV
ncbi:MAG: MFS transporter [Polyangiaceae bacterium]|jgi:MFS transporter, SHS family, lactate transporter